MNIIPLILQFLVSGFVVVGATLLAKSTDSKWAGLLVALPTLTVLGLIFISINSPTTVTQRYLISALIFMAPAAIYILSLYLLFTKVSLLTNLIVSLIPFTVAVIIAQRFLLR